jgi:hypothetical protein
VRLRVLSVLTFVLGFPLLLSAQTRSITVSGVVRDASTGQPIPAVSVIRDTMVVAVTNEEGRYRTQEMETRAGVFTLLYRRLGYSSSGQNVSVPETGTEIQLDITLLPTPTDVDRIVVQGERMAIANPGLVGFYERREQGFGRYLTGEEIRRIGGTDLTNHLRLLQIRPQPRDETDPFARTTFSHCIAAYVDGVRLLDLTTINEWVPASSLGGIEVHRPNEFSHLPHEFVPPPPPGCRETERVIMFWSKVQRGPSPFEIGMHVSFLFTGDHGSARYLGGQFVTPVSSRMSTLRLHLHIDARVAGEGSKWRALINLTMRPFGHRSPLYAGAGFGIGKKAQSATDGPSESIEAVHAVLAGMSLNVAYLRPFLEVQILNPLTPSRTGVVSLLGMRFLYTP